MDERDLLRKYAGLGYEYGRLPRLLARRARFGDMPHEVRRLLFRVASPAGAKRVRKLRSAVPHSSTSESLRLFCETRTVFVHIPKTAGNSVGWSLYGRKLGGHRRLVDYELCFSKAELESFFKFAFVRNPWDRLVSAYRFMTKGGKNRYDVAWSRQFMAPFDCFREFVEGWVTEENVRKGFHFRPQCEFVVSSEKVIGVDQIYCFEEIERDYEYLRERLGFGDRLQVRNRTDGRSPDYRDMYDAKTKDIVGSVYRDDIREFSYRF